jgi:molybdate transport system substrate-binding protein
VRFIVLPLLAACGMGAAPPPDRLTVLAASSLSEAFADLEAVFEARHPGVDVVISFAGSQALSTQVRHGISADVFASADEEHVASLTAEGQAGTPRAFAGNTLVLVVSDRLDQPITLETLPELGSLVVGDDSVPVGRYTRALFDAAELQHGAQWRAAVESRIVSREPSVRLAAAKVALGEADAAIVYATDVIGLSGVHAVALPEAMRTPAAYFHAPLSTSEGTLAQEWIALVESPTGQGVLSARGFKPLL